MIQKSKQTWEVGQTVQVGFLRLTVHSFVPKTDKTLNDTFPYGSQDGYLLMGLNGESYLFRPHCGIAKI